MRHKYKMPLIIIAILFVFSITFGVSYSLYFANPIDKKNTSLIETSEVLSVNYLNGRTYDETNLLNGDELVKKISVTNVSDHDTFVTISLMDVEKNCDKLKLKVVDNKNDEVIYEDYISNVDSEVVKTILLEPTNTISYTFTIINEGEDTKFSANLLTYTESYKSELVTFKDVILNNNKVNEGSVSFKGISNTNEGLIKTNDDLGTAYYFRGNVDNNYVSINGIMFRILRINGDDSIRLITENVLDDLSSYNNNTSNDVDFKNRLLMENSNIKTKLDSFISSNLSDYSKHISTTNYCNDVNVSSENDNTIYLNSYSRLFVDDLPSLICSGTLYKANVGIISADEVVLAGAYQDKTNTSYFLYNPNIKNGYWTMSGSKVNESNNTVYSIAVLTNGSLNADKKTSLELGIRPVISLDKNTQVMGSGTSSDPYTIKK